MHQQHDPALTRYPHGRGYGHDYLRGGEIFGGYGYADRAEYALPRGELAPDASGDGQRGDEQRGGADDTRRA
jgi:hypothetical protein